MYRSFHPVARRIAVSQPTSYHLIPINFINMIDLLHLRPRRPNRMLDIIIRPLTFLLYKTPENIRTGNWELGSSELHDRVSSARAHFSGVRDSWDFTKKEIDASMVCSCQTFSGPVHTNESTRTICRHGSHRKIIPSRSSAHAPISSNSPDVWFGKVLPSALACAWSWKSHHFYHPRRIFTRVPRIRS